MSRIYYDITCKHMTQHKGREIFYVLYVGLIWSKKSGTGSVFLLWRKDNRKILKCKLKEIKWVCNFCSLIAATEK